MNEKLKPCPWPGCAENHIFDIERVVSKCWSVYCGSCGARGPTRDTRDEAIAAWNRRTLPDREALRERLAEYAHEAWSGWMRYLFSKCEVPLLEFEARSVPDWAVARWTRQMKTPYADLPEKEKESDRAEADKMLALLEVKNDH